MDGSRRDALEQLLRAGLCALVGSFLPRSAGAGEALDRWLDRLDEVSAELRRGGVTPLAWQDALAELYAELDVAALLARIDFPRLAGSFEFPERGADTAPVMLVDGDRRFAFHAKLFGMQRGRAIIPHAHNDMVSAHLVAGGAFAVRTYDRVEDTAEAIRIRPSIERRFATGELLTMSDARDNVHWLVADGGPAFTFDVILSKLEPARVYPSPANRYGLIFLDPDRAEPGDGDTLLAPKLDVATALARYG